MKAGIFSHHYKNTHLIVNIKISFLTWLMLCIYFSLNRNFRAWSKNTNGISCPLWIMHCFINKPSGSLTGNQSLGHFTVLHSEVHRLLPFILVTHLFLNPPAPRRGRQAERKEMVGRKWLRVWQPSNIKHGNCQILSHIYKILFYYVRVLRQEQNSQIYGYNIHEELIHLPNPQKLEFEFSELNLSF